MVDWKHWLDKKVYVETRSGRIYTGEITEVDDSKLPLIWITLIDKYNKEVTLVHSEITIIREDLKEGRE